MYVDDMFKPVTDTIHKVGDRVYYKDSGGLDTGTVITVGLRQSTMSEIEQVYYQVKWDWPDDEIDLFVASQLEKVTESKEK